jgi:hypothetical protein
MCRMCSLAGTTRWHGSRSLTLTTQPNTPCLGAEHMHQDTNNRHTHTNTRGSGLRHPLPQKHPDTNAKQKHCQHMPEQKTRCSSLTQADLASNR